MDWFLSNEPQFHLYLMLVFLGLAAIVFPTLLFVTAPYGRNSRKGWGPRINDTLGWVLMEFPAPVLFGLLFFLGDYRTSPVSIVFLCIWELHYINRTFIFPFRLKGNRRDMPVTIMLFGMIFNFLNAYIVARYLYTGSFHNAVQVPYELSWFRDPRFIIGVVVFFVGFFINQQSDSILRNLLKPGETGYKIPYGGMFRFVSCPNYMGELLEWTGFAIATWCFPVVVFVLWTAANLAPRAFSTHKWYKENFPDYPKDRKALIPFIV